jgi:hypothetical protein
MRFFARPRAAAWLACCLAFVATGNAPGQEVRRERVERTGHFLKLSAVMEARVILSDDARIGKIVDVVLNDSGCVEYVVVSEEDKYVLVPWGVVTVNFEERVVRVDITREKWRDVPTFGRDNWPTLTDSRFTEKMRAVFGERFNRREGRPERDRGEGTRDRTERDRGRTTDRAETDRTEKDRAVKDRTEPARDKDRATPTDRTEKDRAVKDRTEPVKDRTEPARDKDRATPTDRTEKDRAVKDRTEPARDKDRTTDKPEPTKPRDRPFKDG